MKSCNDYVRKPILNLKIVFKQNVFDKQPPHLLTKFEYGLVYESPIPKETILNKLWDVYTNLQVGSGREEWSLRKNQILGVINGSKRIRLFIYTSEM